MQENMYKQAIADAKALRASAIANAKATLQETFAPQVEAIVKQSLREDLEEDLEESTDKEPKDNGFGAGKEKIYSKKLKLPKSYKGTDIEDFEESEEELEESEEEMDEASLEEILGELEEIDEDYEEEGEDLEEAGDEEEVPEGGEDDEEIVLTFGQLKQALAPFISGEEGMEAGEEDMEGNDADVDLDEILGEESEEELEESEEELEESEEELEEKHDMEEGKKKMEERKKKVDESKHKKEMEEARKAIEELRGSLNEVNLLNAKLLYMNKLFKAKSLTESQKVKVVGAFDRASSVKEVKNIYATLNESISATKKTLKESFNGYASKPAGYAPKQNITEADPFVTRMQKLAGIK